MGDLRLEARRLQYGRAKSTVLLAVVATVILLLFGAVPFFLQFFSFSSLWASGAKTVFLFSATVFLPLFLSCLRLGAARMFCLMAKGDEVKTRELFHFFGLGRIFRAGGFCFFEFALKLLSAVIFFSPFVLLAFVIYFVLGKGSSFEVAMVFFTCLFLTGAVGMIFYSKTARLFFLAKYLFVSDEKASIKGCFHESVFLMRENTGKLLRLRLGFAFWFMLCIFVIPIAYVWGYHGQTMAIFAQKLLDEAMKEF